MEPEHGGRFELGKVGKGRGNSVEWWWSAGIRGSGLVLNLEKAKTDQVKEIVNLKKRVKKLVRNKKSRTSGLKILWKVVLTTRVESYEDKESLDGDEVIVDATTGKELEQSAKFTEKEVSTADPVTTAEDVKVTTPANTLQISKDELTLAQTLIEIKAAKPNARGVIDEVQDKIDADMELAQKLQTKEQEQLTDAEKARLFMEFLEKIRNFFVRKREIEKRNRPPTKAQQRSLMCIYLKNLDGWKLKNLKKYSFDEIQKLFDSVMKRVNTFMDINTDIVEEREDLEVLWSIVKERFKKTKPVDDMDNLLFQTLKTMFEHHAEDNIWRINKG
nr:hypothetical protein [Tanacetum cinerariifolium]